MPTIIRPWQTETFSISIPADQDTYVHTFTGSYNVAPTVLVEWFEKRVSSIVVTLIDATITLLDTAWASGDGYVVQE